MVKVLKYFQWKYANHECFSNIYDGAFCENISGFQLLTTSPKNSITDVWEGPKYTTANTLNNYLIRLKLSKRFWLIKRQVIFLSQGNGQLAFL